ncbi:hypothetical protein L7F22_054331 [Adiantum nelumboides]|nr:hypothetical protein [Adiantum nelumboides]
MLVDFSIKRSTKLPPPATKNMTKFAREFAYENCATAKRDPKSHKIAWALIVGMVLENVKYQKGGLNRKVDQLAHDLEQQTPKAEEKVTSAKTVLAKKHDLWLRNEGNFLACAPILAKVESLRGDLHGLKASPIENAALIDKKEAEIGVLTRVLSMNAGFNDATSMKDEVFTMQRADALDHQVQPLCIESKRLEENNEKLQALKREQELKCTELEALTKQSLLEKENASLKMSLEIFLEKLKLSDSEQERLHIKLKDIEFSLQKSIHEWDALNADHVNKVAAFRRDWTWLCASQFMDPLIEQRITLKAQAEAAALILSNGKKLHDELHEGRGLGKGQGLGPGPRKIQGLGPKLKQMPNEARLAGARARKGKIKPGPVPRKGQIRLVQVQEEKARRLRTNQIMSERD